MALPYNDDFQSYAVGDNGPWGSLTSVGGIVQIISDTAQSDGVKGAYGKDKYLACFQGGGYFDDATNRSDATVWFAFRRRPGGARFNSPLITFYNTTGAPPGTGFFVELFTLFANSDGTISPQYRANPCGPPSTFVLGTDDWDFFQVNITFSSASGNLHLVYEVARDGDIILTGSFTGGGFGGFPHPSATWNAVALRAASMSSDFGELTIDALQAIQTFPNPGTPKVRSTNQVIELITIDTSAALIRITKNLQVLGA